MTKDDQFIVYGGSIDNKYGMKNCTSLANLLLERLNDIGNDVLLINASTNEKLTATQLQSRSIYLAHCLEYNGIKQGDTISICTDNQFEFVYLLFACIYLGVSLGLLEEEYSEKDFNNTENHLNSKIIFTSLKAKEKIIKLTKIHNNKAIVFGNDSDIDIETYDSFINNPNILKCNNFTPKSVDIVNTVAIVLQTSGTTSPMKSVQMTHTNLLCMIWEYNIRSITPNPLVLSSLLWARPFGFRMLLRQMIHNTTMVFLPHFVATLFLKAIENYKPTIVNLYVTTTEFLAKSPLIDQYDLSSVKVLFSCSAPLDTATKILIHNRLAIPIIEQGYGMSEFGSIADQNDNFHKVNSVGSLRKGVFGKIIDLKTFENLGPNNRGQLMIKGPNIMKGYLGNGITPKNPIDNDGWLITGDFCYFDESNELFIVERMKDLIYYKDIIIPPREVELLLKQQENVKDAVVFGISDNTLPVAYVVPRDNQLTKNDLLNFINDKSEYYLHDLRFIDAIPTSAAGKRSRLMLRQMFMAA